VVGAIRQIPQRLPRAVQERPLGTAGGEGQLSRDDIGNGLCLCRPQVLLDCMPHVTALPDALAIAAGVVVPLRVVEHRYDAHGQRAAADGRSDLDQAEAVKAKAGKRNEAPVSKLKGHSSLGKRRDAGMASSKVELVR